MMPLGTLCKAADGAKLVSEKEYNRLESITQDRVVELDEKTKGSVYGIASAISFTSGSYPFANLEVEIKKVCPKCVITDSNITLRGDSITLSVSMKSIDGHQTRELKHKITKPTVDVNDLVKFISAIVKEAVILDRINDIPSYYCAVPIAKTVQTITPQRQIKKPKLSIK